jgi:hypothetical protein
LESEEQAGMDIVQRLLAAKLLKQFDTSGDGRIDRSEFTDLLQPDWPDNLPRNLTAPFPDENRDGWVDLGELESFLSQRTCGGLQIRGVRTAAFFSQVKGNANQPVDRRQLFKAAVETYWQKPGGATNRPPFNWGLPPGRSGATNRIPDKQTP